MARRRRAAWLGVAAALAALGLGGGTAAAQSLRVGGFSKAYTFVGLHEPHALERTGARFQLETQAAAGAAAFFSALDFDVDGRQIVTGQGARGEELDVYPVEVYATYSAGPLDLRLGRQFVFWGGTTWSPPADQLSPWDRSNMSAEIEDYRVARTGARGLVYLGGLTLDLVWLPIFEGDRGPAAPATLDGLPVETSAERPPATLAESEIALRVSDTLAGLDWALTALRGRDKQAEITVQPRLAAASPGGPFVPQVMVWQQRWPELQLLGLDLARAFDPFLLRLETAYSRRPEAGADAPLRRPSSLRSVASLGYQYSEDLSCELQLNYERLLPYDRAEWQAAIDRLGTESPAGALPRAPRGQELEGSLLLRLRFSPRVAGQALVMTDLQDFDLFSMTFVSWELASGLNAYLGAVVFWGDDDTTYGRLTDSSQAFAELKYSF